MLELLDDPDRCQVVLVTLPETTPVNELIETAAALAIAVGVRLGPVVVNEVDDAEPPSPDPATIVVRPSAPTPTPRCAGGGVPAARTDDAATPSRAARASRSRRPDRARRRCRWPGSTADDIATLRRARRSAEHAVKTLDTALRRRRRRRCCGSGGVGKTTTAAAIGLQAARRGRGSSSSRSTRPGGWPTRSVCAAG